MKDLYLSMNKQITPSPTLISKTINAVVAPAVASRKPRRLAFVPILALLLALVAAVPALAAGSPGFNALLYRIAPEVAMYFRPVNRTCTDQGITVGIMAVDMEEDNAVLYVSVQGDGVNETTMLHDSWHFGQTPCAVRQATQVAFDPETHTAVFRLLYVQGHGIIHDGEKVTLTVERILLERGTAITQVEGFAVRDVQAETEAPGTHFFRGQGRNGVDVPETVMQRDACAIPIGEGLCISAVGTVAGKLRIQIRNEHYELNEDVRPALLDPAFEAHLEDFRAGWDEESGARMTAEQVWLTMYGRSWEASIAIRDDHGVVYTDYVFGDPLDKLADDHLYIWHTATTAAVDGQWSVTFPLEDYAQE